VDAAEKTAALRSRRALNPRPEAVTDPAFLSGNPFFDRNDLVQVKYEMLRRVRHEALPVGRAAAAFGFSRPSFYAARAVFDRDGLAGLVPRRPGPRRAHKLSDAVVEVLARRLADDPSTTSTGLAQLVAERFGVRVHPRSVERALARRKGGAPTTP
jgi:transposase